MRNPPKWAISIAGDIVRNISDFDRGEKTFVAFHEQQRELWNRVSWGEKNIIGSACHRRHTAVQAALNRYHSGQHP